MYLIEHENDIKYLTDEEIVEKLTELANTLAKVTGKSVNITSNPFTDERCRKSFIVQVEQQQFEIREAHNGQFWWRG